MQGRVQLYALNVVYLGPFIIVPTPMQATVVDSVPGHAIDLMKMGPHDTYLCFTPPSIKQGPPPPEETITEVTASRSWSLLQPLDGTCLYVCDVSPSSPSGYMTAAAP